MRVPHRVYDVDLVVPERAPAAARPSAGNPARAAGWLAGAAVVSAALAVDPDGLRSFSSLRWLLVSACTGTALLVTTRAPRGGALPPAFRHAGALLLALVALSTAAGVDPATAWLGHPQRHLGALAAVVLAAAATVGARLDAPGRAVVAGAAWVAGGALAVTALVDALGWDPVGTEFAGGRVGGTLGQPTTLAALAVLLVPVSATIPHRTLRVVLPAALVATVLVTQTRGALVGLLAVVVVSWPALRRRRLPPRAVAAAVGAAAIAVALSPIGPRLSSAPESDRVDEWRLAAGVIAERPLLGAGPEGYRIAVLEELDPAYVDEHGREVVVDRAHSAPLDVAAASGIPAAALYVALQGMVVIATWRLQRRRPGSLPAALGAGAVGLFAAGWLAFPVPEIDVLAWLFAGVALAQAAGATRSRPGPARHRLAGTAAGVLVVVTLVAGITDVVADRRLATALDAARDGRVDDARRAADAATDLRPDLVDAWYVAAQVSAAGPTILDLDAAIGRVQEGLGRSPRDPALRDLEVRLLGERALRSELGRDRSAARDAIVGLLADDPTSEVARTWRERLEETP